MTGSEKLKKAYREKEDGSGAAAGDKKNDGPTTVVLKVDMHCEGCAIKVMHSVKRFEGLEAVAVDPVGNMLTVIGKVDPVKLRERVEVKTRKKVDLISLTNASQAKNGSDGKKKPDAGGVGSGDNKDQKKPTGDQTPKQQKIVLKVQMDSEKIRSKAMKLIVSEFGVYSVAIKGDQLIVFGCGVDAVELTRNLRQKIGYADIMSIQALEKRHPHPMTFGLALVFHYEELKDATNCFHPSRELGGGGFGRVYLGELPDGRMVAVKKLYDEDNPKLLEQFFNEVTVLSRLRHKNLVALYGCTNPESRKLLLVYEFVPNGTVADHLHGQRHALSWAVRIQIAIETAEALTYLHSIEPPIIHRDVKTSNILLDDDFHVKVADLGMCRLVPWDSTHVSTAPQGTVGYRDPEYDLYCRLTDKSDVYSFGVVLLELVSGKQAVDVNRDMEDVYLTRLASRTILNKQVDQLVDSGLGYHSDFEIKKMIDLAVELVCMCLLPQATLRPSMEVVLMALKEIQNGAQAQQIQCKLNETG